MNPNAVSTVPTILVCVIIGLCFLGRLLLFKGFIIGLFASGSFEKKIDPRKIKVCMSDGQ